MKTIKSEMPAFIQGMYATVLGVSFYKAFEKESVWLPAQTKEEAIAFFGGGLWREYGTSVHFMALAFFMLTLTIFAHDWYRYHKDKAHTDSFWRYLPQVFAIFFLAQMLIAIERHNLKYWFGFAMLYSLCNISNAIWMYDKRIMWRRIGKNAVHFGVATICFLFVPAEFECWGYWFAFGFTTIVVFTFWLTEDKDKPNGETPVQDNAQPDAIALLEAQAKAARNAFLEAVKAAQDTAALDTLEAAIKTAEQNARKARQAKEKELEDKLAQAKNKAEENAEAKQGKKNDGKS